jgi:hypothetical protein
MECLHQRAQNLSDEDVDALQDFASDPYWSGA